MHGNKGINFHNKRINYAHFFNDYYHLKKNSATQTSSADINSIAQSFIKLKKKYFFFL